MAVVPMIRIGHGSDADEDECRRCGGDAHSVVVGVSTAR